MNKLNLVVYASAVILLATTVAGVYFQKPQTMEATYRWLPAGFLNRTATQTQWGDLTRFTIKIECGLTGKTTSAPAISYKATPMAEEQLRTIAADVFGMKAPEKIDDNPLDGIWLKQTYEDIGLTGQRVMYMASTSKEPAEIQDWNLAEVRRIADEVIDSLEPYWGIPTDAVRRVSFVGPSAWQNSDKWITEFSTRYTWSVGGIDIVGNGCTVAVTNDGYVVVAVYDKPAVYVVGEQQVTVTPEEALANFTNGQSINRVLGAPRVKCIPPENATVVIKDVSPVYYPLKSPDGEVEEVLVYRIDFEIISEDSGHVSVLNSLEYEYAN